MVTLPPEDQPPEQPFTPARMEDAVAAMGPPTMDNPAFVGDEFRRATTRPGGPDLERLRQLVTPESRAHWGDFQWVAAFLAGTGTSTRANPSVDDPSVVYVAYVESDGPMRVGAGVMTTVKAIGTLVHRASLDGWRLHALGDYVRPEVVPHD